LDNIHAAPGGSTRNDLAKMASACVSALVLMVAALEPAAAQTVAPPKEGLRSNHNYYLYNDGKPIHGLVVKIKLTEDVVCDEIGFHVQLNADSPTDSHTNWQQYVMGFNPNYKGGPVVGSSIEYFASPYDFNVNPGPETVSGLPGPTTLPAGAKFIIKLKYDGDNVSGAEFTYEEKGGKNRHKWKVDVPPAGLSPSSPTTATAAQWVRTPIVAFQVDLVGRSGGDTAMAHGGAGTITYSATDPMTVRTDRPPSKGQTTAETANSSYGLLPTGANSTYTQTFTFN
jgi:hypothetical protein